MRYRHSVLVLLLAASAGCGIDFVEISGETPAQLNISIVADHHTDRLALDATLNPGRDGAAQVRAISTELRLHGHVLEPVDIGTNGTRRYRDEWSLSGTLGDSALLTITLPEIAGIGGGAHLYEVQLPRRHGPAALHVADGELITLVLHSGAPAAEHIYWRLIVAEPGGGTELNIAAPGAPPAELVVPPFWLPAAMPPQLDVRVNVEQRAQVDIVAAQYRSDITIHSTIDWTVSACVPAACQP